MRLLEELLSTGVKCCTEEIIFITRNGDGFLWLEKGDSVSGLTHIVENHASDFKRAFNVDVEHIPSFLELIVSCGMVVAENKVVRNGRVGIERIYDFCGNEFLLMAAGSNGYIVSAYPIGKGRV